MQVKIRSPYDPQQIIIIIIVIFIVIIKLIKISRASREQPTIGSFVYFINIIIVHGLELPC